MTIILPSVFLGARQQRTRRFEKPASIRSRTFSTIVTSRPLPPDQRRLECLIQTRPHPPSCSLIFKDDGYKMWPIILQQLQSLQDRDCLTFFDGSNLHQGPHTVVGINNTPFELVQQSSCSRALRIASYSSMLRYSLLQASRTIPRIRTVPVLKLRKQSVRTVYQLVDESGGQARGANEGCDT